MTTMRSSSGVQSSLFEVHLIARRVILISILALLSLLIFVISDILYNVTKAIPPFI